MNEFNQALLSNPFYWIILITSVVIIVVILLFSKQIIGWFGEYWTKKELNKLPKDKYIILNDVFISINDTTHQIDHIVVSSYGIFCIETKQYNGYITGDKYDKYWVRHAGRKKYNYTNPIRQNYGHVKSLSELLSINENKIFNVVCIPSKAKLKINHDGELVRNSNIVDKILSYKETIIEDVNDIVKKINDNNISDKRIKKEHVKTIKEKMVDKSNYTCPKCGGKLVE